MKRLVSLLTLSLFLFSQVASTEAAHSLSRSHLRTRAAAQSSADGGKGKAPMVSAIWEALTGKNQAEKVFSSIVPVAKDGASKVIPLTEDAGWVEVKLDIIPSTPDEVARIIDEKNIRYIFNEWTLREKGRGVTGGVKKVSDKGNLIVVGPATRPLLEVGIPTDRSSFSSGFGEQYGRIYDSDGTIKLIYETLRVYKHPDLDYRIATIDGAVVRTDDLRNVRTLLEGTYNFEKPFEPFVPLTLTRDEAIDKALTVLEARGIQEVVLLVSDGTGDLKGVQVDVSGNGKRAQFRRALQGQPVVPVSSEMARALLTSTPQEPYYVSPDPYTLMVDPFDAKRMMFISEVVTDKGKSFENDPRYRMRQFLQKLWVDHQQIPVVGLEPEWFLISRDRDGNPVPTDFNLYYDRFQDHPAEVQEILLTALEALRAIGISTTNTTSEVAGSQHEWVVEAKFPPRTIVPSFIGKELPFQYLSALRTLDDFMLYKYLLKRTAERFGKEVTFEAKPFEGVNGSGMHHHLSFWKADTSGNLTNLFSDPQKIVELSPIGQSAAEGVMRAGREMFVFTNQSPADMFRHVAGFEAPVYTGFISEENRSSPIRRPKTTSAPGARFEYRVPAPDDNMYLSTGVILSAAHLGMEQNLEMRKPIEGKNIYHVSNEELLEHLPEGVKDLTVAKVPESYQDAIEIATKSLNEGGTIAKLQDVGFLTQDLALEFLRAKKRQLAQAVRTPYPFPAETVAHDGGTKGQDLAVRDGGKRIDEINSELGKLADEERILLDKVDSKITSELQNPFTPIDYDSAFLANQRRISEIRERRGALDAERDRLTRRARDGGKVQKLPPPSVDIKRRIRKAETTLVRQQERLEVTLVRLVGGDFRDATMHWTRRPQRDMGASSSPIKILARQVDSPPEIVGLNQYGELLPDDRAVFYKRSEIVEDFFGITSYKRNAEYKLKVSTGEEPVLYIDARLVPTLKKALAKRARDGGGKVAEWSREKITAVLTRESDFMPVGLSSASRNVNDISPTLLTMKDVGAVLVSEELLAADASLVKRLSNWPKNVPLVLLSPSGNWKNIFAKINEFSKGLQQVNPAQFAAMITPQTEGIVDINDAENVIEVAEFMTGNKIVAYAVEREISDPYRNILQGSYGIVYDLPEEGSREVTLGAGAFNELLKFLALSPDEQAEVLKALNGIRVVKPSAVAGELGQYVFEYSQTIRGL